MVAELGGWMVLSRDEDGGAAVVLTPRLVSGITLRGAGTHFPHKASKRLRSLRWRGDAARENYSQDQALEHFITRRNAQ